MTIREIWSGVADAINDGLITEETGIKVVNTEVVPKLLVEKILEELNDFEKEINKNMIGVFDDGYLCAIKDVRHTIENLLKELGEDK